MRFVRIGKIVAPYGARGFVRVASLSRSPSKYLMKEQELYLEAHGRPAERHTVEAVQGHRSGVLLKLAGIDSQTVAETFVGMLVSLPEDALSPPGEHEFYYYEIVGFRVRTTAGNDIGTIRETFPTGSNDVWVVVDGTREYLIPVIADVVRTIDRVANTVTIEPMEGLLDL
jgi:16S rRNA processing protein RimM